MHHPAPSGSVRDTVDPRLGLGSPSRVDEDRALFRAYRSGSDPRARERIVERFLPLARKLARRYQRANEPIDDLEQVASLALLKAVDRFDVDYGTAFSTFAVPTILGELKRHFRDSGWAAHVPRALQERAAHVSRAAEALVSELGRSPTIAEIAQRERLSEEKVLEAMDAAASYSATPLDGQPGEDGNPDRGVIGRIGRDDAGYELVELGASIEDTVARLSQRERALIHLRFVEDLTQAEIARRLGISQMHVSRLLRRATSQLRDAAAAQGPVSNGHGSGSKPPPGEAVVVVPGRARR